LTSNFQENLRCISQQSQFIDEVFDFVQFLKTKIAQDKIEALIASESSLQKDWLRQEEDEAWRHL
jgi:hypothetical protein